VRQKKRGGFFRLQQEWKRLDWAVLKVHLAQVYHGIGYGIGGDFGANQSLGQFALLVHLLLDKIAQSGQGVFLIALVLGALLILFISYGYLAHVGHG